MRQRLNSKRYTESTPWPVPVVVVEDVWVCPPDGGPAIRLDYQNGKEMAMHSGWRIVAAPPPPPPVEPEEMDDASHVDAEQPPEISPRAVKVSVLPPAHRAAHRAAARGGRG